MLVHVLSLITFTFSNYLLFCDIVPEKDHHLSRLVLFAGIVTKRLLVIVS